MKNETKLLVEKAINEVVDFNILEDDKYLLFSYSDMFEKANNSTISHFLLLLHMYRQNQKSDKVFNEEVIRNQKKGIPELEKTAVSYAKKLQQILAYKGSMTKDASNLNDFLYDLVEKPDKYFPNITLSSKNDLREFFKGDIFEGKRTLTKKFIDSLDMYKKNS